MPLQGNPGGNMKRSISTIFLFMSIFLLTSVVPGQAQVVINEVLFDPSGAGDGDANGDGTQDFRADEFIELKNTGSTSVDISSWTLSNLTGAALFTFPTNTVLEAGELCVVFGGVGSSGFGSHFPSGLKIFAAQQGATLGFDYGGRNNLYSSAENVVLKDESANAVAEVYWGTATSLTAFGVKFASPNTSDGGSYSGTDFDQSVTRETDGTGLWAKHSILPGGLLYSPGALNSGEYYASSYCHAYGSNAASYIDVFTVEDTNFTSGAATYSDFTNKVIYLAPGSDNVYFKIQKADAAACYFALWIDYNCDGDFNDSGEEIFTSGPLYSYTSRNVYIPANLPVTTTRLRIAVKQGSLPSPCDTSFIGEVEDYTVNFASIVINEVLFDPFGAGDANGDGTIDFRSDEFIELMNITGSNIDIGDWILTNAMGSTFFTFPIGTTLQPGELCVVFGGVDSAAGFGNQFPPSLQIFASQQGVDKGFEAGGNNNLLSGSDNVLLRDSEGRDIAEVYWGTASAMTAVAEKFASPYTVDGLSYSGIELNQSVARLPDGNGLWAKHSFLYSGALYSPGTMNTAATGVASTEGYYKVLFMDGGVNLTSKTDLPAAEYLDISLEHLATADTDTQSFVMISNSDDDNGRLLYPDGEPRFRVIFTNGGTATNHGTSLGEDGRNRVRDFYNNGGSFTGSCAGAFIASLSNGSTGVNSSYYHLWPGRTTVTNLFDSYTGHFIESGSPLLNYYDFGGDLYISNVYHNGGTYPRTIDYPANTEVLLRYDYSALAMHRDPSCWAYKDSNYSGRVCVIGSHPESVTGGERMQLMAAMIQYALDGQGTVKVKDTLSNGVTRYMDKSSTDNDPAYTKIGDKQYHHFQVQIPAGTTSLEITLDGDSGYDLNLYANPGAFAFNSSAAFKQVVSGSDKVITIPNPSEGAWFIAVECATTVYAEKQTWGYDYSGNVSVLNGVEYSIEATWY
jgi:glutamine amidotransferase-like uncharacterized protein